MVTEYRQLSSCDTVNQLQHRRVLVKDDNYITHTYAVLDARKHAASKGTLFHINHISTSLTVTRVARFSKLKYGRFFHYSRHARS